MCERDRTEVERERREREGSSEVVRWDLNGRLSRRTHAEPSRRGRKKAG